MIQRGEDLVQRGNKERRVHVIVMVADLSAITAAYQREKLLSATASVIDPS